MQTNVKPQIFFLQKKGNIKNRYLNLRAPPVGSGRHFIRKIPKLSRKIPKSDFINIKVKVERLYSKK